MPHLKEGTRVKIKDFCEEYNEQKGVIEDRDGEYYMILLDSGLVLTDIYLCELEVI